MDFVSAIVLGVLQGVFEWLPVSSKSIVTIAGVAQGMGPAEAFGLALFLHIGTMVAAIAFFRNDIAQILRADRDMQRFLLIALGASAITGLPAYWLTKNYLLTSGSVVAVAAGVLLIGVGALQWASKNRGSNKACDECIDKNAVGLGLAQGLSILPGVSRSGITVTALLLESFSPEQAFRISFLLSIPTILAFEAFQALTSPIALSVEVGVAALAAFVAGYLSLEILMRAAKKIEFSWFAIGFGLIYIAAAFLL